MEPQQPADLHFERQLQACEQTICKMLPPQPKRMSDYSEALIEGLGLTTDDTLADARRKVQGFYPGMKSVGLGNAAISGTGLLVAQLSPGLNGNLDEYDIVIVTDGSHNGAVVRSWGARIKCAPVSADTPWQTDACG